MLQLNRIGKTEMASSSSSANPGGGGSADACNNCQSTNLGTDPFTGDILCLECGAIAKENRLVADLSFAESGGKKSVLDSPK